MRTRGGYIQNRGTSWRIAYYDINHERQFESFETEDQARRELATRIAQVAAGVPISSKPNMVTFGELAVDVHNDYKINKRKSIADMLARLELHILPVFGKRKAAQITTAQLNAYIVRRKEEKPAPSDGTINRELELIRHTFKMALDSGRIIRMPKVPHLRENNTRSGFFNRTEVERLCAAMKEPYSSFTMFGFLTGWRYSEVRDLQWRNVDFQAGEIRLDPGTTKSGDGRVFPMTTELRALLIRALGKTDDTKKRGALSVKAVLAHRVTAMPATHVFSVERLGVGEDGNQRRGRYPVGQFQKTWKAACHKAGLPCVVEPVLVKGKPFVREGKPLVKVVRAQHIFHDLRRSAAREFQRQGFTDSQIMRMCGWKSRSVFDRYNVVTNADIREKMRAIEESNGARNGATGTRNTRSDQ